MRACFLLPSSRTNNNFPSLQNFTKRFLDAQSHHLQSAHMCQACTKAFLDLLRCTMGCCQGVEPEFSLALWTKVNIYSVECGGQGPAKEMTCPETPSREWQKSNLARSSLACLVAFPALAHGGTPRGYAWRSCEVRLPTMNKR